MRFVGRPSTLIWLNPQIFIVSKGSRRVYTDRRELQQVLSGQVYNRWKSSMVGAVTVIQCKQDGRLMTAEEALKQGKEAKCCLWCDKKRDNPRSYSPLLLLLND